MPIYSPTFSKFLADIAASYQPSPQNASEGNMSPEPPPAPVAPGSVDYSMHDTDAMARAEANPNGTIYDYPNVMGDPHAHNLRFGAGDIGFPSQRLGNDAPPPVPENHQAKPHELVEEKVMVGGGLGGRPHEETRLVDKNGSLVGNLVGKLTGDPRVGITEEEKRASDEAFAKKQADEAKKAEPFGPPPPPSPEGFTQKPTTPTAPKAGARAGGGGGGAGGGGSASMSMSSTEPGTLAGGGDWDRPELTARGALSAIGMANADIAGAEGEAAQRRQEASDRAAADSARIQHEYDRVSQEHFNKLEQLNREVAEGKIDPEQWAKTRSAGAKVLYMLGAAIGGFGAGFRPGTPNYAMEMIKNEVDQNIEAQRANLEGKSRAAEGEKGLLGEIYNRTHNMQQSVLLAKDLAYEKVGNQLQELTAASHSSIANANALLASADWQKWQEEHKEHTAEFLEAEAQKRYLAMMRARKGAGGGPPNNKDLAKLAHELSSAHLPELERLVKVARSDLPPEKKQGLFSRLWERAKFHWSPDTQSVQRREDMAAAQTTGARVVASRYGGPAAARMAEMAGSGDPIQQQKFLDFLDDYIASEKKGIYAGHDPATIGTYEDRMRMMGDGAEGGVEEPDLLPADEGK